jgi:plasmid stabilization system protein ParE
LVFQVDITEPALADAEDHVRFIRDVRKEPEAADRWFRGLVQAIYSLEGLPERCPLVPEQCEFSFEIRHLIYLSHRIIFRIEHEASRVIVYLGKAPSFVRVAITDAPPEPNYVPDSAGAETLRVIGPGRLAELEELYELDAGAPRVFNSHIAARTATRSRPR